MRSISSRGPMVRAVTHSRAIWHPTTPLRSATAVARSKSIKRELREYLEAEQPCAITGAVWQELLKRFAPVSESYLRDLLRQTGLPFEQPYAGVRQHTFEELEQSLRDLLAVYSEAAAAGDRDRARYCRRQVIAAKDRAKFLAANPQNRGGEAGGEDRDGAVDVGVAGESRGVSGLGGRAKTGDGRGLAISQI